MNQDNATIGPLMRVDLELRAIPPGIAEKTVEIASLSFIHGIGISGLTPFEKALTGKTRGERLSLDVSPGQFGELFGHLACNLMEAIPVQPPWRLEVTVGAFAKAGDRELVKAMAGMGGCGGGCGCGCG